MIFVPSRFRRPRGMNTCLHSLRFPNHIKILFLSASSVLFSAFRRHPQSFCGWHSFHTCVLSVKFLFTIGAPSEYLFSCKIFSAAPSAFRLSSALPVSAFIAFFSLLYILGKYESRASFLTLNLFGLPFGIATYLRSSRVCFHRFLFLIIYIRKIRKPNDFSYSKSFLPPLRHFDLALLFPCLLLSLSFHYYILKEYKNRPSFTSRVVKTCGKTF